jgi:hypothetical protein
MSAFHSFLKDQLFRVIHEEFYKGTPQQQQYCEILLAIAHCFDNSLSSTKDYRAGDKEKLLQAALNSDTIKGLMDSKKLTKAQQQQVIELFSRVTVERNGRKVPFGESQSAHPAPLAITAERADAWAILSKSEPVLGRFFTSEVTVAGSYSAKRETADLIDRLQTFRDFLSGNSFSSSRGAAATNSRVNQSLPIPSLPSEFQVKDTDLSSIIPIDRFERLRLLGCTPTHPYYQFLRLLSDHRHRSFSIRHILQNYAEYEAIKKQVLAVIETLLARGRLNLTVSADSDRAELPSLDVIEKLSYQEADDLLREIKNEANNRLKEVYKEIRKEIQEEEGKEGYHSEVDLFHEKVLKKTEQQPYTAKSREAMSLLKALIEAGYSPVLDTTELRHFIRELDFKKYSLISSFALPNLPDDKGSLFTAICLMLNVGKLSLEEMDSFFFNPQIDMASAKFLHHMAVRLLLLFIGEKGNWNPNETFPAIDLNVIYGMQKTQKLCMKLAAFYYKKDNVEKTCSYWQAVLYFQMQITFNRMWSTYDLRLDPEGNLTSEIYSHIAHHVLSEKLINATLTAADFIAILYVEMDDPHQFFLGENINIQAVLELYQQQIESLFGKIDHRIQERLSKKLDTLHDCYNPAAVTDVDAEAGVGALTRRP